MNWRFAATTSLGSPLAPNASDLVAIVVEPTTTAADIGGLEIPNIGIQAKNKSHKGMDRFNIKSECN